MRQSLNAVFALFCVCSLALSDDFRLPRAELDEVIAKASALFAN